MPWYSRPSKPYPVKDGISVKSTRGPIGTAWWTLATQKGILSKASQAKVTRGKSYARSSQIVDFSIGTGEVLALVQGSYREPYRVRIQFQHSEDNQQYLQALYDYLADHPSFLLQMAGGGLTPEMVQDLKEATKFEIIPPESFRFKAFSCTCPDYSRVCKHLLAVLFLLSEHLDEDPMLLFPLAGVGVKTVLREHDRRRSERLADNRRVTGDREETISSRTPADDTSLDCNNSFWEMGPALAAAGRFVPAEDPETVKMISAEFYQSLARNDRLYAGTFTFSTNLAGFRDKAMVRADAILKAAEKIEAKRKKGRKKRR